MPGDYEVGYGKPPTRTQFKRGQSGNPKGRPEGTKDLKTDLMEEMRERILVREGGTQKQLSKERALLKALTAKAIRGDTRAANVVLSMVLRLLEDGPSEDADMPLSPEEWAILQTLEERLPRKREIDDSGNAGSEEPGVS